ncbi:hypothetical protein SAMN05720470_10852 [Fibrobacter sp. UWOV1]|nr:hypothetical protein SAMN05720470_10852 [Fibrobacter sp. UWOV1]
MDRSQAEELISRRLCDFETAIPAKVTAVAADGTISVVALIKKVTVDGIVDVDNMVMDGIRPFTIGNSSACIDIEIEKGSQVLLVGLSRHAREWLGSSSDDAVIPKSPYGNMLNDLVAVPLFRTDRDSGKASRISLGVDGTVLVESKYGQSLKFNSDGSIDLNPKSGKKVKIGGDLDVEGEVNDSNYNLTELGRSYDVHMHAFIGVPPGTASATDGPMAPPTP